MFKLKKCIELIRVMDSYNLEFLSSGNFSIRLDDENIAIKPSGLPYKSVNINNISIINSKGDLLQGLKPSSDFKIHLGVYNTRKGINCIIHTHSHFATVFAILGKPIEVLSTMHADYFGEKIPCLPFVNHRYDDFGKILLNVKSKVVLLEKHGAFIFAKNPDLGVKYAIILEEVARLNYHALLMSNKKKIKNISSKNIRGLYNFYNFSYLNKN